MSTPFTDYLRALDPDGEPPTADQLGGIWEILRSALIRDLRQRGLWHQAPTTLGIVGWNRWTEPKEGLGGDALDELVADLYAYVFVDRLRSLRAQANVKTNIEGLVHLNVKNFVHDRQREHDPLGYRTFDALRGLLRRLVAVGVFVILRGDPRIRNDTVLARHGRAQSAPRQQVAQAVASWTSWLIPDLLVARGRAREGLFNTARYELERSQLEAFAFKDMIDPLKVEIRARWATILTQEYEVEMDSKDGSIAVVTAALTEDRNGNYHDWTKCVSMRIDSLDVDARTGRYVTELWRFLLSWSQTGAEDHGPSARSDAKLPSNRSLARRLSIPRDRLPELFELLGQLCTACRHGDTSTARRAGERS
ncbi:MAG: hypothetical protein AAGD38_04720 [Acidobacteriota bacterium]